MRVALVSRDQTRGMLPLSPAMCACALARGVASLPASLRTVRQTRAASAHPCLPIDARITPHRAPNAGGVRTPLPPPVPSLKPRCRPCTDFIASVRGIPTY